MTVWCARVLARRVRRGAARRRVDEYYTCTSRFARRVFAQGGSASSRTLQLTNTRRRRRARARRAARQAPRRTGSPARGCGVRRGRQRSREAGAGAPLAPEVLYKFPSRLSGAARAGATTRGPRGTPRQGSIGRLAVLHLYGRTDLPVAQPAPRRWVPGVAEWRRPSARRRARRAEGRAGHRL